MNDSPRFIFNDVAELYDAVRPGYPEAIIQQVASRVPDSGRILEIGCGTGQATKLLARHGVEIVTLEPGKDLAAIASIRLKQTPGVTIEPFTFEEYPLRTASFDMVLAATSFHWVTPEERYTRSARALVEGGSLALLWNYPPDESNPVSEQIQEAYDACFPRSPDQPPYPSIQNRITQWIGEIDTSGLFETPLVTVQNWSLWYSTDKYIQLLETYSDHIAFEQSKKDCLYDRIRAVLEGNGGGMDHFRAALLVLAKKRAS